MSIYFVGDVHGCYKQLKALLEKVEFNYRKDKLWITGDLVSKGPDSMKVLNFLNINKNSIKTVLGNHDLNLIRLYFKNIIYSNKISNLEYNYFDNNFRNIINLLRFQPIVKMDFKKKFILSHAGIPPQLDIYTVKLYAKKIEKILRSDDYEKILELLTMMHNNICIWNKNLSINEKLKFAINSFTRMRYCFSKTKNLDLEYKVFPPEISKNHLIPWFLIKNKIPKDFFLIFGHWSSLNGRCLVDKFYALDTGCCKGNKLTLLRWKDKKKFYEPFY
ncbi:symmetrical bis(5'-nucleosyl)-tetraphosphatase [Buchnera aphidicola (Ceratoglyphina bambusae)]|uniref:symmetrical bis(5'-nucleosyl)-tetraphosphatase n=1 Tax=Buchnera aphidicola TaxID=9 RepID=UPI0031B7F030